MPAFPTSSPTTDLQIPKDITFILPPWYILLTPIPRVSLIHLPKFIWNNTSSGESFLTSLDGSTFPFCTLSMQSSSVVTTLIRTKHTCPPASIKCETLVGRKFVFLISLCTSKSRTEQILNIFGEERKRKGRNGEQYTRMNKKENHWSSGKSDNALEINSS